MGIPEDIEETATPSVDGTPSDTATKVDYEKRYKDTLKAFTKSRQELAAANARIKALETKAPEISTEEKQRLEELKFSDPEAWYIEKRKLEEKNKAIISANALQLSEAEIRKIALDEFNETSEVKLTEDMLENDIPRRLTRSYEAGSLSYEDYLQKAADWIKTPKVVAKETINEQPNLSKIPGSATKEDVSKEGADKSLLEEYKDAVL